LQLDGRDHHAARHQVREHDEENATGEQVIIFTLFSLVIWTFVFSVSFI
jgi:hypothetical protein